MDWKDEFFNLLFPIDGNDLNVERAYDLKYRNFPRSVFKYMKFDAEGYSLEHLKENTVWLSDPSQFNDPFDCALMVNFERLYENSVAEKLFEIADTKLKVPFEIIEAARNSKNPLFHFSKWATDSQTLDRDQRETIKQIIEKQLNSQPVGMLDEFINSTRSNMRISSFAKECNNILMWSHYADHHKGFCVAYDLTTTPKTDFNLRFLFPVKYSNDLVDFTEYFNFLVKEKRLNSLFYKKAALVKSTAWEYESEWRLVFTEGKSVEGLHKFLPITAVFLGAKTEPNNQSQIIEIAKMKNIKVYKMELEKDKFALEF